jgi:hypothetical protein
MEICDENKLSSPLHRKAANNRNETFPIQGQQRRDSQMLPEAKQQAQTSG